MKLLYEYFAKDMLTVSFRITNSMEDAEDILQESFLTSFQQINTLVDVALYRAWLKKIVINSSLKAIKKKVRFLELEPSSAGDSVIEEDTSWYQHISFDKIKEAISTLPDGCRQVFTLYLMEDYKHHEIAELLNIAVSTSKSQYRYALKILKEELNRYLV